MVEGGPSENPIVLNEKEDKGSSPPTNSVTEHPTEPSRLLRSCPSRRQIKIEPEFVYKNLFE